MNSEKKRHLFGTDGVRGLTNRELTPRLVADLANAISAELPKGKVVTGCDSRASSNSLLKLANGALNLTGRDVVSLGEAPTPAIQFVCRKEGAAGAAVITASHNPAPYNGVKVFDSSGIEIEREVETRIEERLRTGHLRSASWREIGKTVRHEGWTEDYCASILEAARALADFPKGLTVVVDCGNGVGSFCTPLILRELGFRVVSLNANLDPRFPSRQPEPLPEALTKLSHAVREYRACLGVAHDGDADRAVFVDEQGIACSGDETLAILAQHLLPELPARMVVAPVGISHRLEDVVADAGGEVVHTKVGSMYVSRKMIEVGASLGGEDNGGVFYSAHMPTRDGAMTVTLQLAVLSLAKSSISQLRQKLPRYFTHKDKLPCPDGIKAAVLEKIASTEFGCPVDRTDGLLLRLGPTDMVHIRPSGTEPVLRITSESKDRDTAQALRKKFLAIARETIEKNLAQRG